MSLQASARPLVVAHRGVPDSFPENTLGALASAIDLGVEMVECDVRSSARGELVVFHDQQVAGRPVSELDRRQLALRSEVEVPLLGEVLELVQGRIGIDVEVKEPGCAEAAARLLAQFDLGPLCLLSSFLPEAVLSARAVTPGLATGLISARALTIAGASDLVAGARALGASYLAPYHRLVRPPLLAAAAREGMPLLPWTVNGRGPLRRLLLEESVFGVITDRSARALRVRAELSGPGGDVQAARRG